MRFRVISDLHVDVNENYPLTLYGGPNDRKVCTLICGDISGDPIEDAYWLKTHTDYRGFFITGNHIVYNNRHKPIQDLQNELKAIYPNTSEAAYWRYLEKDYFVLKDEKIVIFGATLWTDYEVGHPDKYINMYSAKHSMNDFRFGIVRTNDGETTGLSPEFCADEHQKTLEALDNVCKKFPDYKIVVMTHHCPSLQSISMTYSGHSCNGAYVSNLEEFIKAHTNIKAWCCGHVHHRHEYQVGQCTVIANPRGYCRYNEDVEWHQDMYIFDIDDEGNVTLPLKKEIIEKQREARQKSIEEAMKTMDKLDNNF